MGIEQFAFVDDVDCHDFGIIEFLARQVRHTNLAECDLNHLRSLLECAKQKAGRANAGTIYA